MNTSDVHIYAALGVAQDKKVCVRALGREVRSKSKLNSSPEADRNWKSINAFATRLGRKMGQHTLSILKLVPNIEMFAWGTGTSLYSMEKNRNWFSRQSSIILIL